MQFKEFLNASDPPVWKVKKKHKKDHRKFMSKIISSDDKDLDALADEMIEKGYKLEKNTKSSIHKWLLERMERIRQCLKLLSEEEQCNLKPPKKWKNGDKEWQDLRK